MRDKLLKERIRKEMLLSREEEIDILRNKRNKLQKEIWDLKNKLTKLNALDNIVFTVSDLLNYRKNYRKILNYRKKLKKKLKRQIMSLNSKEYINFLREHNADKEYIEGARDGFDECIRQIMNILEKGERK